MTDKEKVFVQKFNEMLEAAKEMEKEGNVITNFRVTLNDTQHDYELGRQKIKHCLDGAFLANGYRLKE